MPENDRGRRQEDPRVEEVKERAAGEVKERMEDRATEEEPPRQLFGTFGGVFVPTLLTILGVIMFLREGWVVGNAGLAGGWLIMALAFAITGFTGLSLSSITTNIKIGAGGAFNVISQSLGLEVGGSIGIPLYVSQALAVVMYVFGFRAGWNWIFPDHPALAVDLAAFALLFGIAFVSAGLAFKVQYLILAIIVGSLVSVGWAAWGGSMQHPVQWWGDFAGSPENGFQGIGFWAVFAVFFPASTGIMAGANMSGDLKNPRKSIPLGTMGAIGLSLVIYLALAWWLAASATTEELVGDYTVMIEKAAWGPAVVAGLLGATFSSALSSLVGAPRILQALADHKILPASGFLARRTARGEPRNALFLTGAIVLAALMLRDLNAVAPLITMFFLITYAMINVVVLLEQSLRLVSFRPLLSIPRAVPLLGGAGCLFAMVIVNPTFSIVAVAAVLFIHAWLVKRHLETPYADVRSGLFTALAEWAAKKAGDIAASRERTWKANLLAPVEVARRAEEVFGLLRDLARPKGFVRLLGLTGKKERAALQLDLHDLSQRLQEENVFSAWSVVEAASFGENLAAGMEALESALFTSNVLFLRLPEHMERDEDLEQIIHSAREYQLGVLLYTAQEEPGGGGPVVVWVPRPRQGWKVGPELGNMDLALLAGYKLAANRDRELVVAARVEEPDREEEARGFLAAVLELARMPDARIEAAALGREQELARQLEPWLCLAPLEPQADLDEVRELARRLGAPCLMAMDSQKENALA
jgi:amino acid transporter